MQEIPKGPRGDIGTAVELLRYANPLLARELPLESLQNPSCRKVEGALEEQPKGPFLSIEQFLKRLPPCHTTSFPKSVARGNGDRKCHPPRG
jgi:hypothetical protein